MSVRPSRAVALLIAAGLTGAGAASAQTVSHEQPLDLVNALHTAFGDHHARAVHTKGVMFEGSFTPSKEAQSITAAPIFAGAVLPVVARFSLFAGIADLPETDGSAAPTGLALKITNQDGEAFDLVNFQHDGFVVATSDEFAAFLRAVGASGPGVAHPTPVEQFLSTRPVSQQFFATLTTPASYATATFFGANSFKFINAAGKASYVRYRFVPRAGEHYLQPAELKSQGPNYLQDEIIARVAKEPVLFDWYAQIAEKGDKIEDPSIAWPQTRKLVRLGTFTLTRRPADLKMTDQRTVFLVAQPHVGIEPADPMLILRNAAYPISLGQRQ